MLNHFKRTSCILLVLASTLVACRTPQERQKVFVDKGNTLLAQGDVLKAAVEFKNAIQADPKNPEPYYLAGEAFFRQGKLQESFSFANKAVDRQPDHVGANIMLGQLFLTAREFDKACAKAELVLLREPGNLRALMLRGAILLGKQQPLQAKELLAGLLPDHDKDADLYMLLATAYTQLNDSFRTETTLRQGIEKCPKSVPLLLALANFYMQYGPRSKAEEIFLKIKTLEPEKNEHLIRLASYYWKEGQESNADALLHQIVEKDQEQEANWLAVANFYISHRQFDKGEQIILTALQRNPKSFHLRFLLKDVYSAQKRYDKASATLQECLKIDPDNPSHLLALIALGEFYCRLGDIEAAESYLNAASEKSSNDLDVRLLKATVLMLRGEFEKAILEYRVVLQGRPKLISIHVRLADAFVRNRQYSLANDTLKNALLIEPDSIELLRALAKISAIKKDWPGTETLLQKIVALRPQDSAAKLELADFFLTVAKDEEKALQFYQRIMNEHPDLPQVYQKISHLYESREEWDKALSVLTSGISTVPGNNQLLEECAVMYVNLQRFDEAIKLVDARIKNSSNDDIFGYNLLGKIYVGQQNFAEAEKNFRQCITIDPTFYEAYVNLAHVLIQSGQGDNTIARLEETIASDSSDKRMASYLLLASLYEQKLQPLKAIDIYEQAMAMIPNNWIILNNIAYLIGDSSASNQAQLAKGEELAKKALHFVPGNSVVLDTLGWLQYKMKKLDQAQASLAMAVAYAPDDPVMSYHLALVLLEKGKKAEAQELFERVVITQKNFTELNDAKKRLKHLFDE